ncbi:unnamed protein product [Prunus armeniaca]|uniref:Uncharacterized protein n=1 Tax=Prunus armeniaca TaxID=36596 RepID=A0A6J5U1J2_PRUAR|nr:unnamed protein product [Prunus armeniaca]
MSPSTCSLSSLLPKQLFNFSTLPLFFLCPLSFSPLKLLFYWTKVGFRDSVKNAPVVIGHQDKELLYLFIYNHVPSLQEEHIIGRTDVEIFTGAGVKESQDFKEARKREKMAKLSEEIAVQKAEELIKSIHMAA